MDEELNRTLRRWREAEEHDREDDADAAFRTIFASTVRDAAVPSGFTASTMARVAETSARDARTSRRTRLAAIAVAGLGGVVLAYFGVGIAASLVGTAISRMPDALVGVVVGAASTAKTGASVWSVLASLGRAAAAFAAEPVVTFTILAIQAVAIAALVALQRLLGSDWESSR